VRKRMERKDEKGSEEDDSSPLLTTSLPSSSPSYSLPLSLPHLNPPPPYFSSLSGGKTEYILIFPGRKMSMGEK
jgi:hypothetical protein